MSENKSSISNAESYQEIGDYWDTHNLDEIWEVTYSAKFEVNLKSKDVYSENHKESEKKR